MPTLFLDKNTADLSRRDVALVGLGVNRHEDNPVPPSEVVNQAIAPALATLCVAIANTNFEECLADAGDLSADDPSCLKFGEDGIDVAADTAVAFCEVEEIAFELRGLANLHFRSDYLGSIPSQRVETG